MMTRDDPPGEGSSASRPAMNRMRGRFCVVPFFLRPSPSRHVHVSSFDAVIVSRRSLPRVTQSPRTFLARTLAR